MDNSLVHLAYLMVATGALVLGFTSAWLAKENIKLYRQIDDLKRELEEMKQKQ